MALKLLPSRDLVPGTGEAKYPKGSDPFPPLLSAPQSVGWVLTVFFSPSDLIFNPLGCWEL